MGRSGRRRGLSHGPLYRCHRRQRSPTRQPPHPRRRTPSVPREGARPAGRPAVPGCSGRTHPAARGPPEAPRSPAGRFCDQIRPRIPPPGGQPTPKGPPVAAGAEGSRTTTSGERSTAAPVGTGTTQPHTQLGAWGWFWLTPQTGCATRPSRAARQSSSGRHAPAGTGWQLPHHQQEDLDRKWI